MPWPAVIEMRREGIMKRPGDADIGGAQLCGKTCAMLNESIKMVHQARVELMLF